MGVTPAVSSVAVGDTSGARFVGVGSTGTAVGGTMVGTKIASGTAVAVGMLAAWRTVAGARRVKGVTTGAGAATRSKNGRAPPTKT